MHRSLFALLILLLSPAFLTLAGLPVQAAPPQVYVVSIHGTVWPGTAVFVRKQLDTAYQQGAAGVILDLDTTGGSEAAAVDIKQAVLNHAAAYPIAAFVHDHATGPGSLIAISCKTLAFAPGGSLGDADGGAKSDYQAAASANGRNPAIAAAFVSADSDLPALGVKAGDPLTLTATQAQGVGYADAVTALPSGVLAKMGPSLVGAQLVPVELSPWNTVALWVTQPWATALILAIGLALIMTEILTLHSWGVAGIFGGLLVALIFAAYITVGAAAGLYGAGFDLCRPLLCAGRAGKRRSVPGGNVAFYDACDFGRVLFVPTALRRLEAARPAPAPDCAWRLRFQRRLHVLLRPVRDCRDAAAPVGNRRD